jgi:hypothetical protein
MHFTHFLIPEIKKELEYTFSGTIRLGALSKADKRPWEMISLWPSLVPMSIVGR